jgi:hypothetical protein
MTSFLLIYLPSHHHLPSRLPDLPPPLLDPAAARLIFSAAGGSEEEVVGPNIISLKSNSSESGSNVPWLVECVGTVGKESMKARGGWDREEEEEE